MTSSQPPTGENSPKSEPFVTQNFRTRTLTALILAPMVIIGIYVQGVVWLAMMLVIGTLGLLEFYTVTDQTPKRGSSVIGVIGLVMMVLGAYFQHPQIIIGALAGVVVVSYVYALTHAPKYAPHIMLLTIGGVIYVGLAATFLVDISHLSKAFVWLLLICISTWGADTAAYFGGRLWGKRKLAPKLSPNKTVEGAVTGIIGSIFLATLVLFIGDIFSIPALMMVIIMPFMAILGDLFESALKRYFKVKDSHLHGINLVPGHGGILDRIDSLIFVTLFCYMWMRLFNIIG
jgi:phosphatidate cytidylyltransferase